MRKEWGNVNIKCSLIINETSNILEKQFDSKFKEYMCCRMNPYVQQYVHIT